MPHMPHNPYSDKYRDIKLSIGDRDTIAHATHATQNIIICNIPTPIDYILFSLTFKAPKGNI